MNYLRENFVERNLKRKVQSYWTEDMDVICSQLSRSQMPHFLPGMAELLVKTDRTPARSEYEFAKAAEKAAKKAAAAAAAAGGGGGDKGDQSTPMAEGDTPDGGAAGGGSEPEAKRQKVAAGGTAGEDGSDEDGGGSGTAVVAAAEDAKKKEVVPTGVDSVIADDELDVARVARPTARGGRGRGR
eukprot:SAG22_NODE_8660_length_638_cov_1.487941_1_plen_184_part_10